jgi:putative membrane protein
MSFIARQPPQQISIVSIYILLLAGGLWHALGVLQAEMRVLASPMIIAISLLLGLDYFGEIGKDAKPQWKFVLWSSFVIIASFFVELFGVKTGALFGKYAYLEILQPTLWGVPIAIGFAWLGMIFCSAAIAGKIITAKGTRRQLLLPAATAWLMVIFDLFMEPAAGRLGYWRWESGMVPARNYLAWFVFGYFFSYIGLRLEIFNQRASTVAIHAYVAQLLYFAMVNVSK